VVGASKSPPTAGKTANGSLVLRVVSDVGEEEKELWGKICVEIGDATFMFPVIVLQEESFEMKMLAVHMV